MADAREITGRAKGGVARRDALSPKRRSEIAKRAAAARWAGPVRKATHGSADHPIRIGDIEIPCYVLEGEIRVISQRSLQTGIGMSTSGGSGGAHRLALFVASLAEKGVETKDLAARIASPILFYPPGINKEAYGYEATIVPDLCDAILAARDSGSLLAGQSHIAKQCEVLVRGLARVGIIALVDEATGYQRDRAKDALGKILEAFIAKELQPWLPTFPSQFYEQMFRLRGLDFPAGSVKRPQYFGMLTNDVVYKRLAPGVLDELKRVTPKNEATGRHKHHLFRRLTGNTGYPKLREHLGSVVAIMELSTDWRDFMSKLDRLRPRYGETIPLPLEYRNDDGKGL